MTMVALIGADGAGKTTVARAIEAAGRLPVKYLYLGVNAEASNHLLPTTRLLRWAKRRAGVTEDNGPPPAATAARAPGSPRPPWKRALKSAGRAVSMGNRVADEWYRYLVGVRHGRRGEIVLCDRHYLADFAAHDMDPGAPGLSLDRRIHGWMLRHLYPRPGLMIFLDAPPQLLLDRKGEGTVEDLQRRREDYLAVGRRVDRFVVVDASRPLDEVVAEVERELAPLVAGGRR